MGSIVLQCFSIFLLLLFLTSGSSVAEKPQSEATQENRKLEKRMLSSPSPFTTQLDTTVPIINPTTPGTITPTTPETPPTTTPGTTPTVNPATSPPPPTITGPGITPPAPTGTTTAPGSSGGSWCIASPTAAETALQVALDYACGYGGADCSSIQPEGRCYNPNTVHDHASFAFNDYYHKNPASTSCDFGGTAQLTNTDPSNGNCHYPSTTATNSNTTPANPPPSPTMTTTPPTTTTPMTPSIMTPDGSTVYGAGGPTGLPSSATSASCSILLLFTATAFVGPLLVESYL